MPAIFDDNTILPPAMAAVDTSAMLQRLARIEQLSGQLLPSELKLSLAQSSTPDDQLNGYARVLARSYQLTPNGLFQQGQGAYSDYWINPVTGGYLSFSEAKQALRPFEKDFWEAQLQQLQAVRQAQAAPMPEGARRLEGRGGPPSGAAVPDMELPKAGKIVEVLSAMGAIDGAEVNAQEAYSWAVQGALWDVDPELLGRNLDFVENETPGVPPARRIEAAMSATRSGKQLRVPEQVLFLVGGQDVQNRMLQVAGQWVPRLELAMDTGPGQLGGQHPLDVIEEVQHQGLLGGRLWAELMAAPVDPHNTDIFDEQVKEIIAAYRPAVERGDEGPSNAPVAFRDRNVGQHIEWFVEKTLSLLNAASTAGADLTMGAGQYAQAASFGITDPAYAAWYQAEIMGPGLPESFRPPVARGFFGLEMETAGINVIDSEEIMADWNEAWAGRTYAGRQLQTDLMLPSWTAPVLELAWGWYLAPDSLITNAMRASRSSRALANALGEAGVTQTWIDSWTRLMAHGSQPRLGNMGLGEFVVAGASHATHPERAYAAALNRLKYISTTGGIPSRVWGDVFAYVQEARRLGTTTDIITRNVDNLILKAAGIRGSTSEVYERLAARIDEGSVGSVDEFSAAVAQLDEAEDLLSSVPQTTYGNVPEGSDIREFYARQITDDDPELVSRLREAEEAGFLDEADQIMEPPPPLASRWELEPGDRIRWLHDTVQDNGDIVEEFRFGTIDKAVMDDDGVQTLAVIGDDGVRHAVTTDAVPVDLVDDAAEVTPVTYERWWEQEGAGANVYPGGVRGDVGQYAAGGDEFVYHGTPAAEQIDQQGLLTPSNQAKLAEQEFTGPLGEDLVWFGDLDTAKGVAGADGTIYRLHLSKLKGRVEVSNAGFAEDGLTEFAHFGVRGDIARADLDKLDAAGNLIEGTTQLHPVNFRPVERTTQASFAEIAPEAVVPAGLSETRTAIAEWLNTKVNDPFVVKGTTSGGKAKRTKITVQDITDSDQVWFLVSGTKKTRSMSLDEFITTYGEEALGELAVPPPQIASSVLGPPRPTKRGPEGPVEAAEHSIGKIDARGVHAVLEAEGLSPALWNAVNDRAFWFFAKGEMTKANVAAWRKLPLAEKRGFWKNAADEIAAEPPAPGAVRDVQAEQAARGGMTEAEEAAAQEAFAVQLAAQPPVSIAGTAKGRELAEKIKFDIAVRRDLSHMVARESAAEEITSRRAALASQRTPHRPAPHPAQVTGDISIMHYWDAYLEDHLAVITEIPTLSRRVSPRGLGSAMKKTRLGDSEFWKAVSALRSASSGRVRGNFNLNIEEDVITNFDHVLRRSRVFGTTERTKVSADIARALRSPRRELAVGRVLKDTSDEMIDKIAATHGWTRSQVDELLGSHELFTVRQSYGELGGTLPENWEMLASRGILDITPRVTVENPIFRTTLPNQFQVVDPVYLRRGMAEAQGTVRRMRNGLFRVRRSLFQLSKPEFMDTAALRATVHERAVEQGFKLGKPVEEGQTFRPGLLDKLNDLLDGTSATTWDELQAELRFGLPTNKANQVIRAVEEGVPGFRPGRQGAKALQEQGGFPLTMPSLFHKTYDLLVRDAFLSWWKPMIVIRPAYVTRVVFTEEYTRFLSTAGMLAKLESGRWTSRALTYLTRHMGGATVLRFSFFDEAAQELRSFDLPRFIGARIDPTTGKSVGKRGAARLADEGVEPLVLRDETLLRNSLAKLMLPNADMSTQRWRKVVDTNKVGPIAKGDPQFWDAWVNDLQNQIGQDRAGQIALRGIRDDIGDQGIEDALFRFYGTDEGKDYLRALGAKGPLVEDTEVILGIIDLQKTMAHTYTGGGHGWLAGAALDGELDPKALRSMKTITPPDFVHGPELLSAYGGDGRLGQVMDTISGWILRAPTDALSRQPYFRTWYKRMLESQYDLARAQGITPTGQMLEGMKAEARRFAIGRVNRIMFDFTRQSRFGELMNFVIPFWQPFGEAFTVWGRILSENPHLVSVFPRIYQAAQRSGVIFKDPDTGEDSINASWMAKASMLGFFNNVTRDMPMDLYGPVNSMNFLIQSTFPVPLGEQTLPIPFPSFMPPIQFLLQQWFDSPMGDAIPPGLRTKLTPWIVGYGRINNFSAVLPSWTRHLTTALGVPGLGDENTLRTMADRIADLYWYTGKTPVALTENEDGELVSGPNPDPPPGMSVVAYQRLSPQDRIDSWQRWVSEESYKTAESLYYARAWWSAVLPLSPRIQFPTDDLERELQELRRPVDQGGMGFLEGTEAFLANHPDMPELRMLTIADSVWEPMRTGTNILEESPVAIPANRFVDEFLRLPYVQEKANLYPELLWMLIPTELRSIEDPETFDSYYQHIRDRLRHVRTPMEKQDDAIEQMGWDAYFTIQEHWKFWLDTDGANVSEASATYEQARHDIVEVPLEQLKAWNRPFRVASGDIDISQVDPNVLAHLRAITADPYLVKNFDAIGGAAEYLELFDATKQRMAEARVTSLESNAAEDIRINYESELADILERHPDWEQGMRLWFSNALLAEPSYREKVYEDANPGVIRRLEEYDTKRFQFSADLESAGTPPDVSHVFNEIRDLEDRAYTEFPENMNPLTVDWESRSIDEQVEFAVGMLDQPYAFMSKWRRMEMMGDESNEALETIWRGYAARVEEIQRVDFAGGETGKLYDRLSAQMRQYAMTNPALAEQIKHANDWTFKAGRLIPAASDPGHPAYEAWQLLLDAVHMVQQIAGTYEMHGREPAYANLRKQVFDYAQYLQDAMPDFKFSYEEIETLIGTDTVIGALIPESYFPIGGYAFVPATRTVVQAQPLYDDDFLSDVNTLDEIWDRYNEELG